MTSIQHRGTEDTETQRKFRAFFLCALTFLCACALNTTTLSAADDLSFKRDIAPVLLNNCLACHGPKHA